MTKMLLIDGSAILHRCYHAQAKTPMVRSDGLPIGAIYGYCNTLWSLFNRKDLKDHQLILVAFDHGRTSFRNDLWSGYKANREVREADLTYQLGLARKATSAFGILYCEVPGFEADDIIATYTQAANDRSIGVTIMSSDKDLMQLVSSTVQMLRPDTSGWKMCGSDAVIERLGVPPHQVGDMLALVGDAVDNVPGVRLIGEKKAAHLLTKFGSLDGIYENLDHVRGDAARASLAASKDKAYLSRELVRLRTDVPMTVPVDSCVWHQAAADDLLPFLHSMEFKQLAHEVVSHA